MITIPTHKRHKKSLQTLKAFMSLHLDEKNILKGLF
jgi:hypothetical protein